MNRVSGAFIGLILGGLIPVVWLSVRAVSSRWEWWVKWALRDWERHPQMYIALVIGGVVILGLIGYWRGTVHEKQVEETSDIEESNVELSHLASTDSLTHLLNKRSIEEYLAVELENSHHQAFSCLMIDIDHFKKINDVYGHPFGDQVLIRVAQLIQARVRRSYVVGRLG